jgi:hypothetical protein
MTKYRLIRYWMEGYPDKYYLEAGFKGSFWDNLSGVSEDRVTWGRFMNNAGESVFFNSIKEAKDYIKGIKNNIPSGEEIIDLE